MSQIKIKALERLQALLGERVPQLAGRICAGPATRGHKRAFPSLAILPTRARLVPFQREPFADVDSTTHVEQVGEWAVDLRLELGAESAAKRAELEALVEAAFLSATPAIAGDVAAELRVGVLVLEVPQCHGARCAFILGEDTWNNERVFGNEFFSVLQVAAEIPALVTRTKLHTIRKLRLALTHDLETVATGPEDLPGDAETFDLFNQ